MPAQKTVAISFRVSPHFKKLLEAAAERSHRSQTNMLETLLLDYCQEQGIAVPVHQEEDQGEETK
jgi:predicted transcriptional regulator